MPEPPPGGKDVLLALALISQRVPAGATKVFEEEEPHAVVNIARRQTVLQVCEFRETRVSDRRHSSDGSIMRCAAWTRSLARFRYRRRDGIVDPAGRRSTSGQERS